MERPVPSRLIIPAVAARLKYYIDVERKEAAFDLSLNANVSHEKYRLYELTHDHVVHKTQRPKKHFLENQMEATLRHYKGISKSLQLDETQTNHRWKRQVQRKIKKNMSALVMPDHYANNHVQLGSINQNARDLQSFKNIKTDISHGELQRLVTSAANLIIATDAEKRRNINYKVTAHIETISPPEATPSLFIRLVGVHGKSEKLFLSTTFYHDTCNAEQAIVSNVEAKDVGDLNQIMMGVNLKPQDCRCYCTRISVSNGRTEYVFPCNKWISSQIITLYVAGHNLSDQSQATENGTENHKKETSKLSANNTNLHDHTNIVSIDKSAALNSSENTGKMEFHDRGDTKEKKGSPISNANSLTKNVTTKALGLPQAGNTRSAKCRRKLGISASSEQNREIISDTSHELCSGHQSGKDQSIDQVPILEDMMSDTIIADVCKKSFPITSNTSDTIAERNTTTDFTIQYQNKLHTDEHSEHGRASSPASYLFFSHGRKSTPLNDKACSDDRISPSNTYPVHHPCMKQQSGPYSSDNKKESIEDRTPQLNLLQQIILESDDGVNINVSDPNFQPSTNYIANQGTEKSNEEIEAHQLKTSDCFCSCEDCSSYETDSSLNDDYLFSDSSLALSPSEEEENEDIGNSTTLERKVDGYIEKSIIFQRSLAAVWSSDGGTLRKLFHAYFFLPSITDEEGKSILHHAAIQGNENICQVLLETTVGMVNVDQQDIYGKTALHYAVENGNIKTIKLLLDKGAKMEIEDKKSKTVLDIALRKIRNK